jgi:hypothetical protein
LTPKQDQSFKAKTWRFTSSNDSEDIKRAMNDMDDAIQKARAGNLTNILHMLVYPDKDGTVYPDYKNFATNLQIGTSKHNYSSLEMVHNTVHGYVGGGGAYV